MARAAEPQDRQVPRVAGHGYRPGRSAGAINPSMKFIFLTGHGSEKDFIAGRSISEYYLIKPVQIDDLVEKIKAAVAKEGHDDDTP